MSKTKTWASSTLQPCVAVNKIAIPVEAPDRVLIVPWGTVERIDGGTFLVDERSAAEIIAESARWGVELPFDYDHHTVGGPYAAPDGRALAAGWIKKLEAVAGQGIYATVEWTRAAAKMIAEKEYRYASPTLGIRKDDGRAVVLLSVALTNTPMIKSFPALVNAGMYPPSDGVIEQLRYWLNLPVTATPEDLMNELEKLLTQLREMAGVAATADQATTLAALNSRLASAAKLRTDVCGALAVQATANDESLLTAINTLKGNQANPRDFVPASEHTKAVERLTKLEGELSANKAAAFVAGGMKSGKIVASNKAMWERLYQAGPEQAEKDLEAAPVIAPPDGRVVTNAAPGGAAAGGGSERSAIINKAKADWASDPVEMGKLCSGGLRGFVNGELLANKQTKLSDEEAKTIAA